MIPKLVHCNDQENKTCTWSSRLRQIREGTGLSQLDFGVMLGVNKQTQLRYEGGKSPPDINYLVALAQHGFDVLYVLTGERAVGVVSDSEWQLITKLRSSPIDQQHAALAAAHGVLSAGTAPSNVTIQGDVGAQISGGSHQFGDIKVGGKK